MNEMFEQVPMKKIEGRVLAGSLTHAKAMFEQVTCESETWH